MAQRPIDHLAVMGTDVDRYAQEARDRERARLEERGRKLDAQPISRRLDLAQYVAVRRRVPIHSDVRLIRHMLKDGRDGHALQRLQRLEVRLGLRATP